MRKDRRLFRPAGCFLTYIVGITSLLATVGCMRNLHSTLPAQEIPPFRQQAIAFLGRAALCDVPVQRMQSLEAFQDVAPKDGQPYFSENIDNGYAGVCFAALMAAGTVKETVLIQRIRTRAEDSDPSVRIAAIYALHRMGDKSRTGELGELLLKHPDARVRANAALAIGRLAEPQSNKLLQMALRREKKDAVVMQILEALAILGDTHGIDRLRLYGYSAVPDQAALALMFLANAKPSGPEVEELFRYRLEVADHPEIKLQAARGLGRLGYDSGLELSLAYLFFSSPDKNRPNDPAEQQVIRVRALAALALEAIGDPAALGPLKKAFDQEDQPDLVKLAIARAAVSIIDGRARGSLFGRPTYQAAVDER